MTAPPLPDPKDSRYEKQVRLSGVGPDGQAKLAGSTVLVVGVGALGSHAADALARAGVGRLLLVDRDVVERSNLQRQVLYTEADADEGLPKAVAAVRRLAAVNSQCRVEGFVEDFSAAWFEGLPSRPDLLLDGTDNFPTRYLMNDLCARHGLPWVYGGAVGSSGTGMAILPGVTACLRCLWPEQPVTGEVETCDTAGILAPAVATVAAFQVAQALNVLCGHPERVARGVFTCELWSGRCSLWPGPAGPVAECTTCRGEAYPALEERPRQAVSLCGRNAVQVLPAPGRQVDLDRLARNLAPAVADLERTAHLLRFRAEDCTFSVFPGGRALLFGLQDLQRARVLYDRYIGAG